MVLRNGILEWPLTSLQSVRVFIFKIPLELLVFFLLPVISFLMRGKSFNIVGTKNQAADSVASAAIRARSHFINKKWLGGTLTNWSTTETRSCSGTKEQKKGETQPSPQKRCSNVEEKIIYLANGIKYMTGLPDIVIIVDQQEEYTALRECAFFGIPTICLIDTNCDPDLADISIPANDDAIAEIHLIDS